MEQLAYYAAGQLTTASLAEYLMPTAGDFPNIRVHATEDYRGRGNSVVCFISSMAKAALTSISFADRIRVLYTRS